MCLSDITTADVDKLTGVLSRRPNYGIARPAQRWQERQEKKVELLPKTLLRSSNPILRIKSWAASKIDPEQEPPAAVLCSCHQNLRPRLIRKIFMYLAAEVSLRTDSLRSFPNKSPLLAAFITRIDSINAYWIDRDTFISIFGTAPHDDRFVRIETGCEACILAAVGANGRTLADLRAQLIVRKRLAKDPTRTRPRPTPRLLRVVDSWIGHLKEEDQAQVRAWTEEVLEELWQIQPALREHKRRSRRRRVPRRRYAPTGTPLPRPSPRTMSFPTEINARAYAGPETQSVYREDSVLHGGELYSPEVIANFRELMASHGVSAGASRQSSSTARNDQGQGYDDSHEYDSARRPIAPESHGRFSGESDQMPRRSFVDRFEREMPIPERMEGFEGYDYELEQDFDASDPMGEAMSEVSVQKWYSGHAKGRNMDVDSIHPALRQQELVLQGQDTSESPFAYGDAFAVPDPIAMGGQEQVGHRIDYIPARSLWTNPPLTGRVQRPVAEDLGTVKETATSADAESEWVDISMHTTAHATAQIPEHDSTSLVSDTGQDSRRQQPSRDSRDVHTLPTTISHPSSHSKFGSTTRHVMPGGRGSSSSSLYSIVPCPDPSGSSQPFWYETASGSNIKGQDFHASQKHNTVPTSGSQNLYCPVPSRSMRGHEIQQNYLYEDSESGSRIAETDMNYLSQRRGLQEVPRGSNPFLQRESGGSNHSRHKNNNDNHKESDVPYHGRAPGHNGHQSPSDPHSQSQRHLPSPRPRRSNSRQTGVPSPLSASPDGNMSASVSPISEEHINFETAENHRILDQQERVWTARFNKERGELLPEDSVSNVSRIRERVSSAAVTDLGFFLRESRRRPR